MLQVFFHFPFTESILPPDGVPLNAFGVMLFLCFVTTAMLWGPKRVAKIGMPREKLQDMAIIIFLSGIAGARILYMIQYSKQFPDKSLGALASQFFQIWKGGIVFYGSIMGGLVGYAFFHFRVIRKLNINFWQLADAIAPLIALGLAIGRIGCYLNGCCWGQVANEECQTVPLSAQLGQFPLLPAHSRDQVCDPPGSEARLPKIHGLQTSTGFSVLKPIVRRDKIDDPRTVIEHIEPGSAAERTGLKPGDRIAQFNGRVNNPVLKIAGRGEDAVKAIAVVTKAGGTLVRSDRMNNADYYSLESQEAFTNAITAIHTERVAVDLTGTDTFNEAVLKWPLGVNKLALIVERGSEKVALEYTPRTVSYYPTQVYETISMILLILFLLAFQPFRRFPGEVMVMLMVGYSIHRFLNEALRIEPTYALGLTLSQWISVGIFAFAIGLEIMLWKLWVKAGRPKGQIPAASVSVPPPKPTDTSLPKAH